MEEAQLKLSRLVSDLLGLSARRMLRALADGETDPTALAALADRRLRATPDQLADALGAATDLDLVYRELLALTLDELHLLEAQMERPQAVSADRAAKVIRELRHLGYRVS